MNNDAKRCSLTPWINLTASMILVIVFASVAGTLAIDSNADAHPAKDSVCPLLPALAKQEEVRVALVVGNGDYRGGFAPLKNPQNDASDVADLFRHLGFDVYLTLNADAAALRGCASELAATLSRQRAGLTVIYYSGHGVQIADQNYLVSIDVRSLSTTDPEPDPGLVPITEITDKFRNWSNTILVFLDACRTNPYSKGLAPSIPVTIASTTGPARSDPKGLKLEANEVPRGSERASPQSFFVAYATSPNDVAADGNGKYSPFTGAFLHHAAESRGVRLEEMMTLVHNSVGEETNWKQNTWTKAALTRLVFLNGRLTPEAIKKTSADRALEATELLKTGLRLKAIEKALSGLPEHPTSGDFDHYTEAHSALYRAYQSRNLRLDVSDKIDAVFDRQGTRVATVGRSFSNKPEPLRLWDTVSGKAISVLLPTGHRGLGVQVVPAFSKAGNMVAAVDDLNNIIVWNAANGKRLIRVALPPSSKKEGRGRPNEDVCNCEVRFFDDDQYLFAFGNYSYTTWFYVVEIASAKVTLYSDVIEGSQSADHQYMDADSYEEAIKVNRQHPDRWWPHHISSVFPLSGSLLGVISYISVGGGHGRTIFSRLEILDARTEIMKAVRTLRDLDYAIPGAYVTSSHSGEIVLLQGKL